MRIENIGQLRQLIANLPDQAPVLLQDLAPVVVIEKDGALVFTDEEPNAEPDELPETSTLRCPECGAPGDCIGDDAKGLPYYYCGGCGVEWQPDPSDV